MLEDKTPSAFSAPARTPRRSNEMESFLCFCFSRQENEDAYYNDGRKGTCSLNLSKAKLIETQKIHILDESSHFYPSANRLKKATSVPALDIFSLHVLYHKLCSNKFKCILLQ